MKPGMLIAYNNLLEAVTGLPYLPRYADGPGPPGSPGRPFIGFWDFAEIEESGGEMTQVWVVVDSELDGNGNEIVRTPARGSKFWPEWIDRPDAFLVELDGPPGAKWIAALIHKVSGHRRERAAVEGAIAGRIAASQAEADAKAAEIRAAMPQPRGEDGRFLPKPEVIVEPEPTDIRDLVGGPTEPLRLDDEGRTADRG